MVEPMVTTDLLLAQLEMDMALEAVVAVMATAMLQQAA
jgi:hypothetical protein